jgi:hypothetical protein
MQSKPWQAEFKRLWSELVPPYGQAKTVQGELIRITGRLSDEAYRNGNVNFDHDHAAMCQYLRQTLKDHTVFSAEEMEQIDRWIDRILEKDRPDIKGPGTCFSHLAEQVVRWCQAKKNLMPHELNTALDR